MKSKNNFSLRGYCLRDSEDFNAYRNESNGPLVAPSLNSVSKANYRLNYKAGGNKGTISTRVRWDMAEFSDESIFLVSTCFMPNYKGLVHVWGILLGCLNG